MGNTRYERRETSEETPELQKARVARYWGTYQRVQELWRMGEKLSLNRWGKGAGDPAEEQEMRQLCQLLEAALVGFE